MSMATTHAIDSTGSRPQRPPVFPIILFAIIGALAVPAIFAAEKSIGKHSQGEIRAACNAAGGTLLGISDSGSYGCEVASSGSMILCNKDQNCTGYTSARAKSDQKKIIDILNQGAKAVSK